MAATGKTLGIAAGVVVGAALIAWGTYQWFATDLPGGEGPPAAGALTGTRPGGSGTAADDPLLAEAAAALGKQQASLQHLPSAATVKLADLVGLRLEQQVLAGECKSLNLPAGLNRVTVEDSGLTWTVERETPKGGPPVTTLTGWDFNETQGNGLSEVQVEIVEAAQPATALSILGKYGSRSPVAKVKYIQDRDGVSLLVTSVPPAKLANGETLLLVKAGNLGGLPKQKLDWVKTYLTPVLASLQRPDLLGPLQAAPAAPSTKDHS